MQQSYRGLRGMQVHAVPDSERAFDASGRKLPWGYELSAGLESHESLEKGPFGRSQRRSRTGLSRSRSKTAEPRREEEKLKAEQLAAEEAVFGSLKKITKEDSRREALGEVDGNAIAQVSAQMDDAGDATEVALYGFGEDLQWAAIDFYERVSGGTILEDYDRQPAGRRYDISRSLTRSTSQRSLTRNALKMKNKYAGGLHWIKVTFDSQSAAELACARSPHIIKGHLVYAEAYMGRGPGKDEPILASQAGAQITDADLPSTFSTNNLDASPNGSSATASSATANASVNTRRDVPAKGWLQRTTKSQTTDTPASQQTPSPLTQRAPNHERDSMIAPGHQELQPVGQQMPRRRTPKIEGATQVVLLPASAAILPKQPKQSWSVWVGAGDVIGSTVPKREDGSFDWQRASLYWKFFNCIDAWFGTDFCGLKND